MTGTNPTLAPATGKSWMRLPRRDLDDVGNKTCGTERRPPSR